MLLFSLVSAYQLENPSLRLIREWQEQQQQQQHLLYLSVSKNDKCILTDNQLSYLITKNNTPFYLPPNYWLK